MPSGVMQTSGEDLDPTGLRYKPRGEGNAPGGRLAALGSGAGEWKENQMDGGSQLGTRQKGVAVHLKAKAHTSSACSHQEALRHH